MSKINLHFLVRLAATIGILKLIQLIIFSPEGRWDAWAIWKPAALFLYHNNPNLFSTELPHPDYPLLLPLLISTGWRLVGSTTAYIPILWSATFIIALTSLLYFALKYFANKDIASLLTIMLIISPFYTIYGASQMADIPLAFFILSTNVCLLLYVQAKNKNLLWILIAGITTGLALHTKNEGALFVFVMIPVVFFMQSEKRLKTVFVFLIGLLPFALAYLYFKYTFAPPNDIIAGATDIPLMNKLVDLNRYLVIIRFLIRDTAFHVVLSIMALLLMLYEPQTRFLPHKLLFAPLIILLGYLFIYLITPHDIVWHLDTSLDRLISHIFPVCLLGIGLSIQPRTDENG